MTKLLQQRIEILERQINQEQRNQCMHNTTKMFNEAGFHMLIEEPHGAEI